ncbi:hypothetical protein PZA11_000404 [Diplocarpon coronariae]
MHISPISSVVVLAMLVMLALTSNASPIGPIVRLPTPTSGNFTASAGSSPANLGFNFGPGPVVEGSKASSTTHGLWTIQTSPPTPSTKTPAPLLRRSPFHTTGDPLSSPESLAAIRESLAAYDSAFGVPSESDMASLSVAQQQVVSDLESMIPMLSEEDRAAAKMIARFITQKLLHPSPGGEERLAQATTAVQNGTQAIARASVWQDEYSEADGQCVTDSEIRGRDTACSQAKKKSKICPNGDPMPASGAQDCPPLTGWQEAQRQGKELRNHRKKKEKADAARDNRRIVRTVFLSVGCFCLPYLVCPLVVVPGAV